MIAGTFRYKLHFVAARAGEIIRYFGGKSLKSSQYGQSGRVTPFYFIIIIMLVIAVYEFGVIYGDWNYIRLMPVNIIVNNERHSPIPGAAITVDGDLIGQTDEFGKITALISEPDRANISVKKRPFNDIDTTVSLDVSGSDITLSMSRPFASMTIVVLDESGKPLSNVDISSSEGKIGETDEEGKISTTDDFYLLDSVDVKLSKKGYADLAQTIVVDELQQTADFAMAKKTTPSPKPPPAPPKSDFQTHFNQANRYLDRAISGESKYYGRALNEIDKALGFRPRYQLAKQLKVEILFNFAKSLRDSNLLYEAANRCGEALKIYNEIPEDHLYQEVQKLKKDIDKKLN
jgi:hypothetical protein